MNNHATFQIVKLDPLWSKSDQSFKIIATFNREEDVKAYETEAISVSDIKFNREEINCCVKLWASMRENFMNELAVLFCDAIEVAIREGRVQLEKNRKGGL